MRLRLRLRLRLHHYLALFAMLIAASACGKVISEVPPDAAPDAPPFEEITETLSHSASFDLVPNRTIGCIKQDEATGNVRVHRESRFVRVFDLAGFGVTSEFVVSSVLVGIERARAGNGMNQVAEVRLYTLEGPLVPDNLKQIGVANVLVSDTSLSVLTVAIEGTAPAGSILVVEFFLPDGFDAQNPQNLNLINIGVNETGQTAPSYFLAPLCNINQFTDTGNLGFGDLHIVMGVKGTHKR